MKVKIMAQPEKKRESLSKRITTLESQIHALESKRDRLEDELDCATEDASISEAIKEQLFIFVRPMGIEVQLGVSKVNAVVTEDWDNLIDVDPEEAAELVPVFTRLLSELQKRAD
jgi:chromosome segregation ATPase